MWKQILEEIDKIIEIGHFSSTDQKLGEME